MIATPPCRQAISETTSLTHNLSHPPTPQSQLYILSDDDHDGDGGVGGDYYDDDNGIIPSPPPCWC